LDARDHFYYTAVIFASHSFWGCPSPHPLLSELDPISILADDESSRQFVS